MDYGDYGSYDWGSGYGFSPNGYSGGAPGSFGDYTGTWNSPAIETFNPATGQKNSFYQPSYFKNLSPLALSYMKQLFPDWLLDENQETSVNAVPYGSKVSGEVQKDTAGNPITNTNPFTGKTSELPVESEATLWAKPELASAQTQKRMQSSGAWEALQQYLELAGEQVKNDWLTQMQSILPMANKQRSTQYNVTRQK